MLALPNASDIIEESTLIRDTILPQLAALRVSWDETETITAKEFWPLPSYGELLFSVH